MRAAPASELGWIAPAGGRGSEGGRRLAGDRAAAGQPAAGAGVAEPAGPPGRAGAALHAAEHLAGEVGELLLVGRREDVEGRGEQLGPGRGHAYRGTTPVAGQPYHCRA